MTIDKAIELLKELIVGADQDSLPDHVDALKLGIEALKRCKAFKAAHVGLHYEPMPGETEE